MYFTSTSTAVTRSVTGNVMDLMAVARQVGTIRSSRPVVAGSRTLELNLEPSAGTQLFDEARHGPASVLVPAWVEELLGSGPV